MKYILIILSFYTQQLFAQKSIYALQLNTPDSNSVSLKNYMGKKILIASGSPEYFQKSGLAFMESMQTDFPDIQMMVIPMQDSSSASKEDADTLYKSRSSMLIGTAASVSDKKTDKQNELIRHLTDVEMNTHFNSEVNNDFTVYLVNESGILYAVLNAPINRKTLEEAIKQEQIKK